MSGHSKWSTIKRQKAVTDARRSSIFTKYARLISVAARQGGKDPASNFRLRLAIDKARAANMPNDNVERAIKAGTGEGKEGQAKEVVYEGFGPGGVAIMVQAVSDNSNRTAAEVRGVFTKHGGSMGGQNSVGWMFAPKGILRLPLSAVADHEQFELGLIDAGADDMTEDAELLVITTGPERLATVRDWMTAQKVVVDDAGVELVPTTTVTLDEAVQQQLFTLLESLEELDDVTNVFSNDV